MRLKCYGQAGDQALASLPGVGETARSFQMQLGHEAQSLGADLVALPRDSPEEPGLQTRGCTGTHQQPEGRGDAETKNGRSVR